MAAILCQRDEDGEEYVVAYHRGAQLNYRRIFLYDGK
jgi:hypothetical protein